jgi:methionyl aminopeptidase
MNGRGFGLSKVKYSGSLRPGQQSPGRVVPPHIARPYYVLGRRNKYRNRQEKNLAYDQRHIPITPELDIERMRVAGRLAREILDTAVRAVHHGDVRTTDEVDRIVHEATVARHAYPSPLNFFGFPKSCCTSLNEVVCHGVPDSTPLSDGDILNIDVTIFYDGVHGDCSETVLIGTSTPAVVRDLVQSTHSALAAAIACCRPGVPFNKIGEVIDDFIKPKGYRSVEECAGHG